MSDSKRIAQQVAGLAKTEGVSLDFEAQKERVGPDQVRSAENVGKAVSAVAAGIGELKNLFDADKAQEILINRRKTLDTELQDNIKLPPSERIAKLTELAKTTEGLDNELSFMEGGSRRKIVNSYNEFADRKINSYLRTATKESMKQKQSEVDTALDKIQNIISSEGKISDAQLSEIKAGISPILEAMPYLKDYFDKNAPKVRFRGELNYNKEQDNSEAIKELLKSEQGIKLDDKVATQYRQAAQRIETANSNYTNFNAAVDRFNGDWEPLFTVLTKHKDKGNIQALTTLRATVLSNKKPPTREQVEKILGHLDKNNHRGKTSFERLFKKMGDVYGQSRLDFAQMYGGVDPNDMEAGFPATGQVLTIAQAASWMGEFEKASKGGPAAILKFNQTFQKVYGKYATYAWRDMITVASQLGKFKSGKGKDLLQGLIAQRAMPESFSQNFPEFHHALGKGVSIAVGKNYNTEDFAEQRHNIPHYESVLHTARLMANWKVHPSRWAAPEGTEVGAERTKDFKEEFKRITDSILSQYKTARVWLSGSKYQYNKNDIQHIPNAENNILNFENGVNSENLKKHRQMFNKASQTAIDNDLEIHSEKVPGGWRFYMGEQKLPLMTSSNTPFIVSDENIINHGDDAWKLSADPTPEYATVNRAKPNTPEFKAVNSVITNKIHNKFGEYSKKVSKDKDVQAFYKHFLLRLGYTESNLNQNIGKSSVGALGIMQVYPKAHPHLDKERLRKDPQYNMESGLKIMSDNLSTVDKVAKQLIKQNPKLKPLVQHKHIAALAALLYNAGCSYAFQTKADSTGKRKCTNKIQTNTLEKILMGQPMSGATKEPPQYLMKIFAPEYGLQSAARIQTKHETAAQAAKFKETAANRDKTISNILTALGLDEGTAIKGGNKRYFND